VLTPQFFRKICAVSMAGPSILSITDAGEYALYFSAAGMPG